ncbi:type IVB secretion system protein IcmM/DotJ [Legionella rowbothamii]|uniref:type IVB secretion system protein IcmM/DotJ n=1 Tax=Legionella rowbothamii TaxID=96229 RepID=UPI0010550DEC|nr:type IVB secretion system protein IcmM/DotJ [Legionella rowbothamii]
MNREGWALIKKNKSFNVNVFRRGLISVIVSLGLSCILGLLMFYVYLAEPERDFYATSGVTPPIKLAPMLAPNMSSQALLPPDPPTDEEEKLIPQ